jgi:monolysocardiolipin acyltransferase
MNDLLPNKSPYIPQFFKKITLNIGTPIFFDEMVRQLKEEKKDAVGRHLNIFRLFYF